MKPKKTTWSIGVSNITKGEVKFYASLKQKKNRELEKKFIIEGTHLVEEALRSEIYSGKLEKVLVRKDYMNEDLLATIAKKNIPIATVSSKDLEKISDTVTPQGIIGVVNILSGTIASPSTGPIIALDNINDPGNMGTILRTAYWYDVKNIIVSENTVDIYNPKVVRGSQGGIFNIFVDTLPNLHQYLLQKANEGWTVLLTDLKAKEYLSDYGFIGDKYIFVLGSEASGVSPAILSENKFHSIKIKPYSKCESLNVGVTAGIILNEFRSKTDK
ncbi:MAG: RNA methyltransferase [Ignavibacteriae bacterium]|nr:RNA methyltransferase [Ignavibacteriota bacterium]